tara:strand:+ start:193 stop:699 length:507 start_codon:yes stop_codon:yes gene_type:complete
MAEYKPTSSEDSLSEENIESQKGEKKINKGWLFGCIGLPAFFAIVSALVIPEIVYVQPKAEIALVLNTMINIVKTCAVRDSEGLSTKFSDIQYLIDEYNGFSRAYKIESYGVGDSCFELVGSLNGYKFSFDTLEKMTWFTINYDPETGVITKKCKDSSKFGCRKGNTW